MKTKSIISFSVALLVWLISVPALAQLENEYLIKKYTSNDGLDCSKLHRIFQDSRGFLWIGSECGVARFDGHQFINFNTNHGLSSNSVQCIGEDNKKNLWVGTAKGICRFNGSHFEEFPLPEGDQIKHNIKDFAARNDSIWVSTGIGLFIIKPDFSIIKFEESTEGIRYSAVHVTTQGDLYFGSNLGLFQLKKNKLIKSDGISSYVLDITEDAKKRLWISTLKGVLYILEPPFKLDSITMSDHYRENPNKLLKDKDLIWVTHSSRISSITPNRSIKTLQHLFADETVFISDIMRDFEGNLWLSTTAGLVRLQKSVIKKYRHTGVDNTIVSSLLFDEARNTLFAGGRHELYRVAGDSLVPLLKGKIPSYADMEFVTKGTDDRLFFGEDMGGLGYMQSLIPRKLNSESNITSVRMLCSYLDKDSSIWIGSDNKIFQINRVTNNVYNTPDELSINTLAICRLDDKQLLLGTNNNLYTFNGGKYTELTYVQELKGCVIYSILKAATGEILVGTKGRGIFVFEYMNGKISLKKKINTQNGLGSDFILELLLDRSNNLWAGTNNGIYRMSQWNKKEPLIEYLNSEDGIPPYTWSSIALQKDNKGNIYIGGSEGLISLQHDANFQQSKHPVITHILKITSATERNLMLASDSIFWNRNKPAVKLNYSTNSISVHFTAISMNRHDKILYSYLLEGYDKTWTAPSSSGIATYNNLPPGKYTFRVKANNQLNIAPSEASFSLTIQSPFWLTWWFRIVSLSIILGLIYTLYKWRLNEQIAKQQLKIDTNKKIAESRFMAFQARMNPHFIFNSLNAIQYFITNNDKQSTLNYLSKFGRLLRQILDNSKESKITVDAEIEMLKAYMDMESMRFENKFEYTITVDKDLDTANTEIPGMIMQPFIENAIIHGLLHKEEKGHIHIHIQKDNKLLVYTIEDDGIGRKRSAELNSKRSPNHRSHGMSIAINRIELLNSDENKILNPIEITDLYEDTNNTGTKVTIKLPIS